MIRRLQRAQARRRGWRGGSLPYADIVALNPAAFIQLRYAVYDGQQVLFQDPACTIPVETAGQDVIGGVKSIIDGSIIATQATEAHRPLWMGESVGARFDGLDDRLTADSAASIFVPNDAEWLTFVAYSSLDTTTDGQSIWSAGSSTDPNPIVFYQPIDDRGDDQQKILERSGSSALTHAYGAAVEAARDVVVSKGTTSEMYRNGAFQDSYAADADQIDVDQFTIGCLRRTTNSQFTGADVSELVIFGSALDADMIAAVDASLEAA